MKKGPLLKEIATLVSLAIIIGLMFNLFSRQGIPLIRTAPVKVAVPDSEIFGSPGTGAGAKSGAALPAGAPAETSGQAVFRIITLEQMKRAVRERRGMILDARTAAEFAGGHIPGAVNLYAMEPEAWVEKVGDLPRDTLMIIYCSNTHCPFGRTLAGYLGAFGFTNMLLFDDGWDAWSEAGLPAAGGGKEGEG